MVHGVSNDALHIVDQPLGYKKVERNQRVSASRRV
jgi:hypothetical protein